MAENFVPLGPKPASKSSASFTSYKMSVLAADGGRALRSGGAGAGAEAVGASASAVSAVSGGSQPPTSTNPLCRHEIGGVREPRVEFEKDGDKITRILIECSCGQMILLDCVY